MRNRPSRTAELVAFARSLARKLPKDARLVDDPYGALFAGPVATLFAERAPALFALPLLPLTLYMQVRTRAIDDVLAAFLAGGGRQVVILGAGYDCRAARFAADLDGARVFEVDHSATQAKKRAILDEHRVAAPASYLPFDFESRPMGELAGALAAIGHDASRPTLTIWEGVTMYLAEPAIDGTARALASLSAAGSPFVLTYCDRDEIERPSRVRAVVGKLLARAGEPFRFGWSPAEFPAWCAERGFAVEWDRTASGLARTLLPERLRGAIERWGDTDHVALLRRAAHS